MPLALFTQDAFSEEALELASNTSESTSSFARRPHALMSRSDTFAHLSVVTTVSGNKEHMTLVNSSTDSGFSRVNHNFIIGSMNLSFQEKQQIVQTFGQNYVFFFGQQPTVLAVQGFLMHGTESNHKNEFIHNYQMYLRGTQCVKNKARVYLYCDDILTEGYIMNCSISQDAQNPRMCQFAFSMLLTQYVDLTRSNENIYRTKKPSTLDDTKNGQIKSNEDIDIYGNRTNFDEYNDSNKDIEKEIVDGQLKKVDRGNKEPSTESSESIPHIKVSNPRSPTDLLQDLIIQEHSERNSVSLKEARTAYQNGTTYFQTNTEYTTSLLESMKFGRRINNNILEVK